MRIWHRRLIHVATLLALTFAAPILFHSPRAIAGPATAPATQPQTAKVSIDNFTFKPRELVITAGVTVTWANNDDVPHTATSSSNPPVFDSKALDTDDKFSFTFNKPGTYRYYCKVHTHMTGTIVVK